MDIAVDSRAFHSDMECFFSRNWKKIFSNAIIIIRCLYGFLIPEND